MEVEVGEGCGVGIREGWSSYGYMSRKGEFRIDI